MLLDLLIKHGTIHKVAKHLSVSQPAATAMLNNVENLIGFRLFSRNQQGVSPTEQTLAIMGRIRIILNEFEDLNTTVQQVAIGNKPALRVGVVPQAFITYLPKTIELFRTTGGSAIRTHDGTAKQLLDLLLAGELDCVIGRLPSDKTDGDIIRQLNFVSLYDEDICIAAGATNPITTEDKPSYQELARHEWVMQRPDSSVRRTLVEAFLRQGVQLPEPIVETSSYVQNLAIVANSSLLTVAPRRAAELQQTLGLIKIINIPLEVSPMRVSFITRKSSARNTSLDLFQDAFLKNLADSKSAAQNTERLT